MQRKMVLTEGETEAPGDEMACPRSPNKGVRARTLISTSPVRKPLLNHEVTSCQVPAVPNYPLMDSDTPRPVSGCP